MLDVSRVQKELVEIKRDEKLSGVSIEISEGDLTRMRGTIGGPHGTPYEGGVFIVDIQLPCEYHSVNLSSIGHNPNPGVINPPSSQLVRMPCLYGL